MMVTPPGAVHVDRFPSSFLGSIMVESHCDLVHGLQPQVTVDSPRWLLDIPEYGKVRGAFSSITEFRKPCHDYFTPKLPVGVCGIDASAAIRRKGLDRTAAARG
jgi:hypothetical protein